MLCVQREMLQHWYFRVQQGNIRKHKFYLEPPNPPSEYYNLLLTGNMLQRGGEIAFATPEGKKKKKNLSTDLSNVSIFRSKQLRLNQPPGHLSRRTATAGRKRSRTRFFPPIAKQATQNPQPNARPSRTDSHLHPRQPRPIIPPTIPLNHIRRPIPRPQRLWINVPARQREAQLAARIHRVLFLPNVRKKNSPL